MKRAISIVIMVALLAAAVFVFNPFIKAHVYAEQYRSGFSLVPVDYDSTGVKTDSSFLLKSQNDVSMKYIEENLTIEGMGKPLIEERRKILILSLRPPNWSKTACTPSGWTGKGSGYMDVPDHSRVYCAWFAAWQHEHKCAGGNRHRNILYPQ